MQWPEKPTCHVASGEPQYPGIEQRWRPARDPEPFSTCYYCGSIHPEDLLCLLTEKGYTLSGSDWKYGHPHKFYLKGGQWGKFYTAHLEDLGYDEEALTRLLTVVSVHSGIG